MRISIREALFTGDEVEAWTPKGPDWIIAQDDNSYEWSPEFIATGKASGKNSTVTFRRFLSIESAYDLVARDKGHWSHGAKSVDQDVKIWYNADLDIALLYFKGHTANLAKYAEPIMEKVSAMSRDEVEKLLSRGHVPYKEFD